MAGGSVWQPSIRGQVILFRERNGLAGVCLEQKLISNVRVKYSAYYVVKYSSGKIGMEVETLLNLSITVCGRSQQQQLSLRACSGAWLFAFGVRGRVESVRESWGCQHERTRENSTR